MAGMPGFYQELPKAELHLHLEGAIEPETLLEIAPDLTLEEIRARYRHDDFQGFLKSFAWVTSRLERPEHYALATRALLARLEVEGVRYAEIILSAGVILWRGQEFAPIFEAVRSESERSPVTVCWLLDAVRQFGVEPAWRVAELAAERLGQGIVGFGIGGDEARGPAEWFGEVYAFARRNGLRLTAHAGETTGPESIWTSLELGAERIGHGIRSVEDPALLKHLRDRDIPLEICISSNVATGAVRSLADHPVRRLYDAGVPIVLNTDDPAMFRTTLVREYEIAAREFGFRKEELRIVSENGFRYSFGGAAGGELPRRPEKPKRNL
jgi:adenosine deaminase/aminodeoxyfutalosine deaminase